MVGCLVISPVKPKSIFREAGSKVANATLGCGKWVVTKTAETTFDGVKWASKKVFNKVLDVTTWVSKVAIITNLAITGLTAVGAYFSPQATVGVVDMLATTLGAAARTPGDVSTIGEVVIIQARYTGEILAVAIGNAVALGAKAAQHTVGAIFSHLFVPLAQGVASSVHNQMSSAWQSVWA